MVPVTTGHGSIDLIIHGVHKANGLRILQARWGIEDSEVVAFGDSGNDVEMLRRAGFGFAMANARPHIKAVARYEAPNNNDEGVLDVIDMVLEGRRRLIDSVRSGALTLTLSHRAEGSPQNNACTDGPLSLEGEGWE